jgi:hypothetical protein
MLTPFWMARMNFNTRRLTSTLCLFSKDGQQWLDCRFDLALGRDLMRMVAQLVSSFE